MSASRTGPGAPHTLSEAWESAITGWLSRLRVSGQSEATIVVRRGHVRQVARSLRTAHPSEVTYARLERHCAEQQWRRETRRSIRRSLVSFFEWAAANGVTADNPAAGLPAVPSSMGHPRPAPEAVWRELLATAAPRELLMVRLAGEAGMRRAEVARCHVSDLGVTEKGASLLIHGKGDKLRTVPISDSLAEAIRGHCSAGYLFPSPHGGHISPAWVGAVVSRLMPPGVTMHCLRHLFGTRAFRGSRNIMAVRVLLGHASVATTQRYVAIDDDEVRAAMMSAMTPP